jgi:hypothetical protein
MPPNFLQIFISAECGISKGWSAKIWIRQFSYQGLGDQSLGEKRPLVGVWNPEPLAYHNFCLTGRKIALVCLSGARTQASASALRPVS